MPAGNHMFKVKNRNSRTKCEICSKLTIKTPELRNWHRSGVFIVNFEHISHIVLVSLFLTLSRWIPTRIAFLMNWIQRIKLFWIFWNIYLFQQILMTSSKSILDIVFVLLQKKNLNRNRLFSFIPKIWIYFIKFIIQDRAAHLAFGFHLSFSISFGIIINPLFSGDQCHMKLIIKISNSNLNNLWNNSKTCTDIKRKTLKLKRLRNYKQFVNLSCPDPDERKKLT